MSPDLCLARADRFPEYHQPLPVDEQATVNGRLVPAPPGPAARFHVAALDEHRGDYELAWYHRTPWDTTYWGELFAKIVTTRAAANAVVTAATRTVSTATPGEKIFGAASSVRAFGPSSAPTLLYNVTDSFDNDDFELHYLADEVGAGGDPRQRFECPLTAGPTFDDTLFKVTATGARVHTESQDQLVIKKATMQYRNASGVRERVYVDLTQFSTLPSVSNGQTVTLTYEGVF